MNENNRRPIRVMVVDDHHLVRYGLKVLMETTPELEFVGESSNGRDAIQKYDEVQPDVLLMDVMMPDMDGIETARMIRSRYPSARIVMLTSFMDGSIVRSALEAGALSFLYKDMSTDALVKAVSDAYEGRATLAPTAAHALIETLREPEISHYNLTPCEIEVLKGVAQGYSNTQIASNMVVSTSTVKKHVSSILSKLKASNRAEAAAWAVRHKVIDG